MENTKVEVKINNIEYTIVSNESEEYVQRVALLVNKKIAEVQGQDSHLSTAMLAVMPSMNLADELLKSDMTVNNLRNEVSTYMDEAQKNGVELENKKLEVEKLREDLHKLEIELAKRETELENLRSSSNSVQKGSAYSARVYAANEPKTVNRYSGSSYSHTSGESKANGSAAVSRSGSAVIEKDTESDSASKLSSASSAASSASRVNYGTAAAIDKFRKK